MKLAIIFLSSRFSTLQKLQGKNLNISWTKRAFNMKWKPFFVFQWLSTVKNCLRPESGPLRIKKNYLLDLIEMLTPLPEWPRVFHFYFCKVIRTKSPFDGYWYWFMACWYRTFHALRKLFSFGKTLFSSLIVYLINSPDTDVLLLFLFF